MCSFHRVFLRAIKFAIGRSAPDDWGVDSASEDEKLAAPSKNAWHKQERRRALKVLRWFEDSATPWKLVAFLRLAEPIMGLHYSLFKHAQVSPSSVDSGCKSMIFDFCKPVHSPGLGVLDSLLEAFQMEHMGLLTSTFGPFRSWPWELKELMHGCGLELVGQVWRRLVYHFQEWPWPLVRVADPDVEDAHKIDTCRALFSAPEACLDVGFSLKVKRLAQQPEALMSVDWQRFLFVSFNAVVVSTAFVECLFAHFKQWLTPIPKPMSVSLLQAKHFVSGHTHAGSA